MAKDYYQALGVNKNSSADEIKQAFRKLAHQHHPDKQSGNEGKFKEINEAYQVLGNEEKRKQYDQFGQTFDGAQGFGGQGFNWQDFTRQSGGFGAGGFNGQGNVGFDFSDLGDIFSDFFGGQAQSNYGRSGRSGKGADLETQITVSFEDSVFGVEKTMSLKKKVVCGHCQGNGGEPGAKIETCKTCGGSGQVTVSRNTFLGSFRSVVACTDCGGEGKKYEKLCQECRGQGFVSGAEEFKIQIPAGISSGETLKMTGKGEPGSKNSRAGDLYIRINVLPHHQFKRVGDDLFMEKEISFSRAALGDKIKIKTLDGEVILKVPSGTPSGKQFIIKDKGSFKLHGRGRGNLIVKIDVAIPKDLNRVQKKLIEELKEQGL